MGPWELCRGQKTEATVSPSPGCPPSSLTVVGGTGEDPGDPAACWYRDITRGLGHQFAARVGYG